MGLNNIELITDRPLDVNLKEIYEVKKRYPDNPVIASLMVESRQEWKEIIKKSLAPTEENPCYCYGNVYSYEQSEDVFCKCVPCFFREKNIFD